jgi:cysteinyl-tRNA synthetase
MRAKRRGIDETAVVELMNQRAQARKDKNFARADEIRAELTAMDVTIQDTPQGATWDVI